MKCSGNLFTSKSIFIKACIVILAICFLACFTLLLAIPSSASDYAAYLISSQNGTVTVDQTISDSTGIKDDRSGILMKSDIDGAEFFFNKVYSGVLELDFRVYSETEYDALGRLNIRISDAETGKSFVIEIDSDSSENSYTPNAGVSFNGVKAGIYYRYSSELNRYNTASGNTAAGNRLGHYTYLYGTSFKNEAFLRDQTVSAADCASNEIVFDPTNMCVYGYSFGEKLLIWDLSQIENDGRNVGGTLPSFGSYRVSFEFEEVTGNASMLLYSVNGQTLDGTIVKNIAGPQIEAEVNHYGIVGKKYIIPTPSAADGLDGVVDDVSVQVFDVNNEQVNVYTEDGNVLGSGYYRAGTYFIPECEGDYSIRFTAKDKDGLPGQADIAVSVKEQAGSSFFCFSDTIPYSVAGIGQKVKISSAYATNEIYFDGLEDYNGLSADQDNEIILNGEGAYTIEYSVRDILVEDTVKFELQISASAPTASINGALPEEVYAGDTVALPSVFFNGEKAKGYIKYPNGGIYSADKFTAVDVGLYEIWFEKDGMRIDFSLTVYENDAGLYFSTTGAEITPNAVAEINQNIKGIQVSSVSNSTVRYSKTISFANKTAEDIFVELINTPSSVKIENEQLTVKLTDVNDPTNFVKIYARRGLDGEAWTNVKASAYGQQLKGLYNGEIKTEEAWGTEAMHSFIGAGVWNTLDKQTLQFSLDYVERQVYINGKMVIDLDDPNHFSILWDGFSADEAYLTIESNAGTYMILSTDGVPHDGQYDYAQKEGSIIVDYGNLSADSLPVGLVGSPYRVFDAVGFDAFSGHTVVTARVFFDYGGRAGEFSIINGCFTPKYAGEYTIEYSTHDAYGNKTVETVKIEVAESLPELQIAEFVVDDIFAGETLSLPTIEVFNQNGGVDISIMITPPDEEKSAFVEGYQAIKSGKYTVTVEATDYIGRSDVYTVQFTAKENSKPILSEINLPAYIRAGQPFVFPDFTATDYSGEVPVEANKSIVVEYDGQKTTLDATREYTPVINGDTQKTLTVWYIAGEGANIVQQPFTITVLPVLDADQNLILENYFQGSSATVTSQEEGILINFGASGKPVEFVGKLLADNFSVLFEIPEEYGEYSGLKFTLIDSIDFNNTITVTFMKDGDGAYLLINNDTTRYPVAGTFTGDENAFQFALYYSDYNRMLSSNAKETGSTEEVQQILQNLNGDTFGGFASGLIYLHIEPISSTDKAGVLIKRVVNQNLRSNIVADMVDPIIYLKGEIPVRGSIGSVVTVPNAVAADVLSSIKSFTVEITSPSGRQIVSGNAEQSYTFTCEEYGWYDVTYTVSDDSKRENEDVVVYSVYVPMDKGPELNLQGEVASSCQVGQKLTLPTAEAKDITGKEVSVYIQIISPDGVSKFVEDGTYTFEAAGVYTVRYIAQDSDYNMKIQDFRVTVK